jgi:hypothetical protein
VWAEEIRKKLSDLAVKPIKGFEIEQLYGKLYYAIWESGKVDPSFYRLFDLFPELFKSLYLYKSTEEISRRILEGVKKLEEELKTIAEKYQLNILGPNCLGFINTWENLNATFTNARVKKGKIAIVSQSGALEVALLDWAEENKAGFSKAISIGNKAVLGESDLLKYLIGDKKP